MSSVCVAEEVEPEEVMQHTPLPSRPQPIEEDASDGGAPTELVPVQLFPEGDDQEQEAAAPVVIKTKIKNKHTNQDRA